MLAGRNRVMVVNPIHLGIGMTSQRTRVRLIQRLQEEGIENQSVLEVMQKLPRHIFVDEALASRAYEDIALPIGRGQTISQPYTVARMSELLLIGDQPNTVLEIGTGSGYQTAVLAKLATKVFSVERIAPLLTQARRRFRELRLTNIRVQHNDGTLGWSEKSPFDGILVTAATSTIPTSLLEQLAVGGRMVLPLGNQSEQRLVMLTRSAHGFERMDFDRVSFVPLLAGAV